MDNQEWREKEQRKVRKSLELKRRLAQVLHDERLQQCAHPKTLRCRACDSFSISKQFLKVWFCGRRYCPVCQKLSAKFRSQAVTEAVIKLMQEYENCQPLIPTVLTFTIPHQKDDPLRGLLLIIAKAWRMLRQGGEDKEKTRLYRNKQLCFWRQFFVGELYHIEMPWNPITGWHVHIHVLAMRHREHKVPLGVHRWTGAILDNTEGVRNLWHHYLQEAWNYYYQEGVIGRSYPLTVMTQRHIEQANEKIQEATIYRFPEIMEDETLHSLQQRSAILQKLIKEECQRLEQETPQLLGREIAAQADIKVLFYRDPETQRSITLTWLLQHPDILKTMPTRCSSLSIKQ